MKQISFLKIFLLILGFTCAQFIFNQFLDIRGIRPDLFYILLIYMAFYLGNSAGYSFSSVRPGTLTAYKNILRLYSDSVNSSILYQGSDFFYHFISDPDISESCGI